MRAEAGYRLHAAFVLNARLNVIPFAA